jgi:hypothetical protein
MENFRESLRAMIAQLPREERAQLEDLLEDVFAPGASKAEKEVLLNQISDKIKASMDNCRNRKGKKCHIKALLILIINLCALMQVK